MNEKPGTNGVSRRDALKLGLASGAFLLLGDLKVLAASPVAKPDVWVITGLDKSKLMQKALETIYANGGFGKSVKKLTLKVNAGWARTPEQGANTHPELVGAFLKGCREAGIEKLSVPEYSCDSSNEAFVKSGIYDAAEENGVKMLSLGGHWSSFASVDVPKGKSLSKVEVHDEFLNSDAVVNMPVAKSHGGAGLSLAMKNWMGAIRDRRFWHKNDLHQCIADFATVVKPTWTIIDGTRVMMKDGPKGPSNDMKIANTLIVSKDQVAADAYAAHAFWGSVGKAKYISIAAEMGLGVADVDAMNVRKLEV